jgi:[histone H4]-N-methyl-L-lysine20 N-methyltransferase
MPRKVKKGYEDEKKATLTLAQLAAYDDVATDALIDQVRSCTHFADLTNNTDIS